MNKLENIQGYTIEEEMCTTVLEETKDNLVTHVVTIIEQLE